MVNSPSRPNVRPVDPPSLGASVRPVFSLPHPGPRPRAGRGQFEIPLLLVAVRQDHQGRIKAKTPAIVPNQGISSQPRNFSGRPASLPGIPTLRLCDSASLRSNPGIQSRSRLNQGKKPSNQGKSSLIKPNGKFPEHAWGLQRAR